MTVQFKNLGTAFFYCYIRRRFMEERRKKNCPKLPLQIFRPLEPKVSWNLFASLARLGCAPREALPNCNYKLGTQLVLDARPNCTQMSSTAAAATILILKTITKVKVSNEYSFEKLNIFMSVIHNKTPRRCDVSEV